MAVGDELARLAELHRTGALSEEEYAAAKARVLNSPDSGPGSSYLAADQESDTRTWAMLLHLSMLAGYAAPVVGLIAPIVIWQIKKTELPAIDQHGKNATNWIISELIYLAIFALLAFLLVGIPLLIGLAVVGLVFPIIAAVKANNGVVWKYPLSIEFFK